MKRSVALLFVVLWSPSAWASPSFPALVDQHLKLSGTATVERAVAPPDGCLLCHMTETGGIGTNNGFGAELRQHGLMAEAPGTLGPALDAVEASDPHTIDDILMGMNPNDDRTHPTEASPQPSYGCDVVAVDRRSRAALAPADAFWVVAFLFAAVAAIVERRRRRDTHGAHGDCHRAKE